MNMKRIIGPILLAIATPALISLTVAACDKDGFDGDEGPAPAAQPTSTAAKNQPDPRCAPDGGFVDNACDLCENASCCATRFGCYDDPGCDKANKAFDDCLAAAKGDGGQANARAVAQCWATLSASGAVAKARVDCQRKSCKAQCEVP